MFGAIAALAGGLGAAGISAAEAGKNRDFQERMTRMRYRYQMTDMRAAGLNPMLSYMSAPGGAPSGAMSDAGSQVSSGINNAISAQRAANENKRVKMEQDMFPTNQAKARAEMENARASTDNNLANEAKARAEAGANSALEAQRNLQSSALKAQLPMLQADAAWYTTPEGKRLRKIQRAGESFAPFGKLVPSIRLR